MHMITNAMIKFEGANAAVVESQYVGYERVKSPRRGVSDWTTDLFGKQVPFGKRWPDDPIYTELGIRPGDRG